LIAFTIITAKKESDLSFWWGVERSRNMTLTSCLSLKQKCHVLPIWISSVNLLFTHDSKDGETKIVLWTIL
jgi:hypothetical protein